MTRVTWAKLVLCLTCLWVSLKIRPFLAFMPHCTASVFSLSSAVVNKLEKQGYPAASGILWMGQMLCCRNIFISLPCFPGKQEVCVLCVSAAAGNRLTSELSDLSRGIVGVFVCQFTSGSTQTEFSTATFRSTLVHAAVFCLVWRGVCVSSPRVY